MFQNEIIKIVANGTYKVLFAFFIKKVGILHYG